MRQTGRRSQRIPPLTFVYSRMSFHTWHPDHPEGGATPEGPCASSSRTDGAQFGLGAEVAISTQLLHARSPMGLKELTTYKSVIVGTGTPNAEPNRAGPSLPVIVDDTPYLVDCGPRVVRPANAATRDQAAALQPNGLAWAFLNDMHADRTLGCAEKIFNPGALEAVWASNLTQ